MSDPYSTPEGAAEEQSKLAAKGPATLVYLSTGKPVECTSCYTTNLTRRLSYPYGVEVDDPPFGDSFKNTKMGWFWNFASDK